MQKLLYSGKKKRHTLKYEIAVRKTDGLLVWLNGPGLQFKSCSKRSKLLDLHMILLYGRKEGCSRYLIMMN
jgi:hypothetical protein